MERTERLLIQPSHSHPARCSLCPRPPLCLGVIAPPFCIADEWYICDLPLSAAEWESQFVGSSCLPRYREGGNVGPEAWKCSQKCQYEHIGRKQYGWRGLTTSPREGHLGFIVYITTVAVKVTEWRGWLYLVTHLPIGHGTLLMPLDVCLRLWLALHQHGSLVGCVWLYSPTVLDHSHDPEWGEVGNLSAKWWGFGIDTQTPLAHLTLSHVLNSSISFHFHTHPSFFLFS